MMKNKRGKEKKGEEEEEDEEDKDEEEEKESLSKLSRCNLRATKTVQYPQLRHLNVAALRPHVCALGII